MKIIILLFALGTTWAEFLPNGCPSNFGIHLLLPHETYCDSYYQCSNGQKILMSCAPGTLFDNDLQICNHAHAVDCTRAATTNSPSPTTTSAPSDTNCTLGVDDVSPHEIDCNKYYECNNGRKRSRICPSGKYFDIKLKICNWAKNVKCENVSEDDNNKDMVLLPNGCPADSNIHMLLPHETDCGKFYTCNFGDKIEMSCNPGTHFHPALQVCAWPSDVNCTLNETTTIRDTTLEDTTITELTSLTTQSTTETTLSSEMSTSTDNNTITTDSNNITTDNDTTTTDNNITSTPDINSTTTDNNTTTTDKNTTTTDNNTTTTDNNITSTPDNNITLTPDINSTTTDNNTTTTDNYTTPIDNNTTTIVITTTDYISTEDVETTYSTNTMNLTTHIYDTTTANIKTDMTTTDDVTTDKDITATAELITTTTINSEATTAKETLTTSDDTTLDLYTTQSDGTTILSTESDHTDEDEFTNSGSTEPTITITTIATTADPSICPDDFFGNLPHPEICDVYYVCLGGIEIQLYCPRGEEFDPNTGICILISESGCTANKETTPQSTTGENIYSTTSSAPSTTTLDYTTSVTTENSTPATEVTTDANLMSSSTSIISSTTEETLKTTYEETDTQTTTDESISTTDTINSSTSTKELTTTELITTTGPIETTTPPICPAGIFGNRPHPEICDSYYMCLSGIHIQLYCPGGEEFDIITEVCKTISENGCFANKGQTTTSSYVTEEITTESEVVVTTDRDNVETEKTTESEIVVTTDRDNVETETTQETSTKEISTIETVITTGLPETTTPPICPPGIFGNRPHPEICDSYYMCLGGIYIQLYCSDGEEFDVVTEACKSISENGCFANKGQTTTPSYVTEETTTESEVDIITDRETTQETSTKESSTTEIVTTTGLPATTTPPICAAGVFGNRPHPEICDSYYICLGGTYIQLYCPGGEEFDINAEACIPISENGCFASKGQTTTPSIMTKETTTEAEVVVTTVRETTQETSTKESSTTEIVTTTGLPATTTPPICPAGVFGNRPHPEICDSYYICLGGTYIQLYCPGGEEFDINTEACKPISGNGCFAKKEQKTTPAVTIDDKTTESEVAVTTERETIESETTRETSTTEPSTIELVTTTGATLFTTPPICPPGVFGYMPHPEICDSYYICLGGTHIQLYCSGGEEFDISTESCKSISEKGCYANKGQTTTAPVTNDDISMESEEEIVTDKVESETTQKTSTKEPSTIEIVTTTGPSETTTPPICPAGVFGNRPHPEICDSYYICLGGTHIQLHCPGGEEFDINTETCKSISENGCFAKKRLTTTAPVTNNDISMESEEEIVTDKVESETTQKTMTKEPSTIEIVTTTGPIETTTPLICPAGVFGNRPHPEICDSYYTCLGGTHIQLYCPGGEEFDINTEACKQISENGCFAKKRLTTKAPVTNDDKSTENEEETVTDKVESETTKLSTIEIVTTTAPTETTTPPICPAGVFGNRPHPENCDSYYTCLGGTHIQLFCPGGEEFDMNTEQCKKISDNGCFVNRKQTTTTSTVTQTVSQASTTLVVETAAPPICPAGIFGNRPHPEICDSYYMCLGGTHIQLSCPDGEEFDTNTENCILISDGGCTSLKDSSKK